MSGTPKPWVVVVPIHGMVGDNYQDALWINSRHDTRELADEQASRTSLDAKVMSAAAARNDPRVRNDKTGGKP
jgi:hypothetical protein